MSAASFLGISAAVFSNGYDGLIYSIGFLVGWPVIMFLMAERLRNLGKFTFADVAAYRFQAKPIRALAASGTLVVVAFYLIAQMVGAGQLIKLLFGLDYTYAVVIVGALMMIYVLFGGMAVTPVALPTSRPQDNPSCQRSAIQPDAATATASRPRARSTVRRRPKRIMAAAAKGPTSPNRARFTERAREMVLRLQPKACSRGTMACPFPFLAQSCLGE